MNIDDIKNEYQRLSSDLRIALSSMIKKDDIFKIYEQLVILQNSCPHISPMYAHALVNGHCPYCGKLLNEGDKNDN